MRFKLLFCLLLAGLSGCITTTSKPAGNPALALENYVQLGRNYLSIGERDQARFNLLKALSIDDRNPDANNVMGLLHETEGELDLAKQSYRRALSSDKSYSPARMNYARVLYSETKYADARNEYEEVTKDINYRLRPDAFMGLGLSELRLGRTEKAKEALGRALQLNPGIGPALLDVAEIAYQQKEYSLSLEYLERYERVTVETPRSLVLGIQLAKIFSNTEKEQTYAMALQAMFPESAEARQFRLNQ